jgi:DNA-binding transcriptional MerR regulator
VRQLEYWDRTGLLSAGRAQRSKKRVYRFEDVLRLRIVARLAAGGLPTQRIRVALQRVSAAAERTGKPWHALRFFTDGHSVFVLNGDNRALDALRDQFVSLVLLGPLSDDTRKVFDSEVNLISQKSGGR